VLLKVIVEKNPLPKSDSGYDVAVGLLTAVKGGKPYVTQQQFFDIVDGLFEVPSEKRQKVLTGIASELAELGIIKLVRIKK